MADLLSLSARYIDEGIYEGPGSVNRVTTEVSEIGDGIAIAESFCHVISVRTTDGLVMFDTSLPDLTGPILKNLREWSSDSVNTILLTHGHYDHVGGISIVLEEARMRGDRRPRIIGHENICHRMDRYELTSGYNYFINARQFSTTRALKMATEGGTPRFGPEHWIRPDTTFQDRMIVSVGGIDFDLHHGKGETDDHMWTYIPQKQTVCCADFLIWAFPNAGNPQKVQRYPLEWADALRKMAAKEPELLIPSHGLPIAGRERIRTVLTTTAGALEDLVHQCLEMMNAGVRLDTILHSVKVPDEVLEKPWLRPTYDEPEFIVRNVWRLYGGWYDGNPAHLKPAPQAALAAEVATLAGGPGKLAVRALELVEAGDFRLACHLVEMAALSAPADKEVHRVRADVYFARRESELSLMSKGIYRTAAEESEAVIADQEDKS